MRAVPSHRAAATTKVLLVDDNLNGILARQSVLEELGYIVLAARSGVEALKLVDEQKFDLIITDFKMPSMNGQELIAHLRQKGIQTPIILLSGYADLLGFHAEQADIVIQKSSHEVAQMISAAKRLLTAPRKSAKSERASRKQSAQGGTSKG